MQNVECVSKLISNWSTCADKQCEIEHIDAERGWFDGLGIEEPS